jgi:hypothetical protein
MGANTFMLKQVLLWCVVVVFIISIFSPIQNTVTAQDESGTDPEQIFVCVEPVSGNPYVVPFRNTTLFGFMVSEEAHITLYSDIGSTLRLDAKVYSINTDAASGGYRLRNLLVSATASHELPYNGRELPCGGFDGISNALAATIRLPVSSNYMLTVQKSVDNTSSSGLAPDIQGMFGIIFIENGIEFQIAQLSGQNIEVAFPFLTEESPPDFVLVGNKSFRIQRSSANDSTVFRTPDPADPIAFVQEDLNLPNKTLFKLMRERDIRIYPFGGFVINNFTPASVLRILPDLGNATHNGQVFTAGGSVTPIEGADAHYFVVGGNGGTLGILSSGTKEIDTIRDGLVLINTPDGGESDVYIESWFVEPTGD